MKRILLSGLLSSIGMLIIGFVMSALINKILPEISREYQNQYLFRPWSDPMMSLYFFHPFVLGFVLAFVWEKVKKLFSGTKISRGLLFGFIFWIAASIPGMFISYSSFPVSFMMVVSWSVNGLAQVLTAGMILAKVNE